MIIQLASQVCLFFCVWHWMLFLFLSNIRRFTHSNLINDQTHAQHYTKSFKTCSQLMAHEWLSIHEHLITKWVVNCCWFLPYIFFWLQIFYQHMMDVFKLLRHFFSFARSHSNGNKFLEPSHWLDAKKKKVWKTYSSGKFEMFESVFLTIFFPFFSFSINPHNSSSTHLNSFVVFFVMCLEIYRHNLSHDRVKLIHWLIHEWIGCYACKHVNKTETAIEMNWFSWVAECDTTTQYTLSSPHTKQKLV